MSKGLLNYTTQIDADKSIGEIVAMLGGNGAQAILTEYKNGVVDAISFRVVFPYGHVAFSLPANVGAVGIVLKRQAEKGKIPKRFINDAAQARRVAWRIVRDWIESQLALIKVGMVSMEQVFLPYAQNPNTGQTVYEELKSNQFRQLTIPNVMALPAPKAVGK